MALKRKFINVEIPLLGESLQVIGDNESLKGKTINLDLTRKLKGKSLEAKFKIILKEKNLIALPQKLELMKFYIRRMMRKRANYVEDSFKAECKDTKIIIKPFLITRKKVSRAVRNNLRRTCNEFIINYIKERQYLEICEDILTNNLQREMIPKLKKVYPLSFCEIRIFEIAKSSDLEHILNSIKVQKQEVQETQDKEEVKEQKEELEEVQETQDKEEVQEIEKVQEIAEVQETQDKEEKPKKSSKKAKDE